MRPKQVLATQVVRNIQLTLQYRKTDPGSISKEELLNVSAASVQCMAYK
jgi:hypothetical protein